MGDIGYVCKHCGARLDDNDLDANINTWGLFKLCCSDCVEIEDAEVI